MKVSAPTNELAMREHLIKAKTAAQRNAMRLLTTQLEEIAQDVQVLRQECVRVGVDLRGLDEADSAIAILRHNLHERMNQLGNEP